MKNALNTNYQKRKSGLHYVLHYREHEKAVAYNNFWSENLRQMLESQQKFGSSLSTTARKLLAAKVQKQSEECALIF